MAERLDHILGRLKEEGAATVQFFHNMPADAWGKQVYDTGSEWDVRQVLAHFVSAEQSLTKLFARILTTGEGSPDDFDIDRWNAGKVAKMADMTPAQLVADFENTRAETVAWVATLKEIDLDVVGRHPYLGNDSVESMLKLLYRHNKLHQRDIRKALETGKPVPATD
jgi:hypothetical protein